jgi:hypothetical protein
MEHLRDWFLELDPSKDISEPNYFSSNPKYGSEIYAKTDSGEIAGVASIPLVLTESDSHRLDELREQSYKAEAAYFRKYKHWWNKDKDDKEWRELFSKYDSTELVYKPRHSHELYLAHLHLVLSSPYMYDLLLKYKNTGVINADEVDKVLNIADGIETPHITRIPKWKRGLSKYDEASTIPDSDKTA